MIKKILVSLAALVFGLLVPLIEIDATHVFNPEWPPHARLHEVWQLITNSSLALVCLWLCWRRQSVRMAAVISAIITGSFLLAYMIRHGYGGSMALGADGIERSVGDFNLGVAIFSIVIAAMLWVAVTPWNNRV